MHFILHRLFPLATIAVLIASSLSASILHIAFEVNQGYIAEQLCIDRDVEESSCNGKCYLMQKIKKQEDEKQEDPVKNTNNREFSFIWHVDEIEQLVTPAFTTNKITNRFHAFFSKGFQYRHDRPPCSLSVA